MKLIVGDKQSSSWSMRGSLMMQEAGIDYDEIMIGSDWPVVVEDGNARLFQKEDTYGFPSQAASGCCCEVTQLKDIVGTTLVETSLANNIHRVPVLVDENQNIIITDLMTIFDYIEENHLGSISLLPKDLKKRYEIKAFSSHVFSDFLPLMNWMPYNCSFKKSSEAKYENLCKEAKIQIDELLSTIVWILKIYKSSGDDTYLFGELSFADIMIAPLAYTFIKWGVPLSNEVSKYFHLLLERPIIKQNFMIAESIYGDQDKYDQGTIQWIANQYRINPRYKTISHINSARYYMFKNEKEFEVFMCAKYGASARDIELKINISIQDIENIMKYFHPDKEKI